VRKNTKTFEGSPCYRGHSGLRYLSGHCVECEIGRKATEEYRRERAEYRATPEYKESRFAVSLKQYNLTPDQYYQLVAAQDYRCKICRDPFKQWRFSIDVKRDAHIDHCHDTGRVRGVLCAGCNVAIGRLKDNPNHCANAVSYLISSNPITAELMDRPIQALETADFVVTVGQVAPV
jgi:hypothetical protein